MEDGELLAYVKVAAHVAGLTLDEAGAQRVAQHLGRTAAMARMLDAVDLGPAQELAEIYRPAPFPVTDGSHPLP
jgi:hypothetical protein